jgi:ATP-dependent helicase/nuclease subunit A
MELEIKNKALDISSNIWINANAGSGKTKILVDRFVKLIISGCDVAKIICITYTKAATNEMRNRVYEMLDKINNMDDDSLIEFLKTDYLHEANNLVNLRQKIEFILNDPNCLRISTIHSLCLDIIKYDNLYENYNIIDEKSDIYRSIKHKVVDKVLDECEKDHDLLKSINLITDEIGVMSFDRVINDIIKNINHLNTTIHDKNFYISGLMKLIDIKEIYTIKDITINFIKELNLFNLNHISSVLLSGGKKANESGENINKWINSNDKIRDINLIIDAILTKTDKKTKALDKETIALIGNDTSELSAIIQAFIETRKRHKIMSYTQALISISSYINHVYQLEKEKNFIMDFNDILYKTIAIFSESISDAEYRVMQSIDHILIDEAQDMSHLTWLVCNNIIINMIDFENKTFFVVGDHKQSIFSFQGANPQLFKDKMSEYKNILDIKNKKMHIINLTHSYRSKQEILNFVDNNLSSQISGYMNHQSNIGDGGIVKKYESTKNKISDDILQIVKDLSGKYDYKDIMILFKDRAFGDSLFGKISLYLKENGIPVSISRHIKISEHLCIKDFMSLFRFSYYPEDDLNLFKLLSSPLFRVEIGELMNLRITNIDTPLFNTIEKLKPDLFDKLIQYKNMCDENFHFFLQNISQNKQILDSFYSEFGEDFNTAFEKIAEKAINFPSPRMMYNALLESDETITQPSDKDGVIFETMHSSKGREAKVVVMIDFDVTKLRNGGNILMNNPKNDAMFFIPKTEDLCVLTKHISDENKKLQIQENIRIKYVAMTRAKDELHIFNLCD